MLLNIENNKIYTHKDYSSKILTNVLTCVIDLHYYNKKMELAHEVLFSRRR